MARVPLQTAPGVELAPGSEVQYGATGVEPMRDVVSDDIARSGKAMQQFGQVISKLDDELNDAEATELSNKYYADVTNIKNKYGSLKGVNAVGVTQTAGEDGKPLTVFEQYQKEMEKVLGDYQTKASNGTVKYIFEKKASVYTRSALSDMTAHSIKEQRSYKEDGIKSSIELSKSGAKGAYKTWNNPEGDFRKFYAKGLSDITELAILNGWNIDPNAIDPTDPKGERKLGISNQYLEEVEKYNKDVLEHVIKSFSDTNEHQQGKDFLAWVKKSSLNSDQNTELNKAQKKLTEKHIEHKNSVCVDATLSNNGNQNDGNFLSQVDGLLCLSSNNAHDNNIGGDVTNGLNSNEVNTTNTKQTENIDVLDKMRSTSKFFSVESSLNGTLIAQHQPTHLFAIQRLGVEKADSLYTKAKSSIEIDNERFKVDPKYATEINGKILDNYNELILEAAEAKYGNKERLKLETQIAELEKAPNLYRPGLSTGPPSQSDIINMNMDLAKNKKLSELRGKLDELEEGDPKYVEKIANDLEIIKNGIDYNFNPEEPGIKVDPVTGLQPIEVLKAKLKATITDPKELATAIKDLEIKYNKTKNERELVYTQALDKAKEVAFAEEGGWKKLAANNINIDDFTEADQEILKNGPPEETDVDTEVELTNNLQQVRDNLPAYRHKISRSQYAQLENYARSLRSEDKYVEATGNTTLLNATLTKNNMGHLWQSKNKKDKKQYVLINNAWIAEINARQITKGNVKLTRGEKLAALNFVLLGDKVNVDNYWTGDDKKVNVHLVDTDRLEDVYVDIPYKGKNERVFTSKIPAQTGNDVLKLITTSLRGDGLPVSQKAIAEYWVMLGRPMSITEAKKNALTYEEEN